MLSKPRKQTLVRRVSRNIIAMRLQFDLLTGKIVVVVVCVVICLVVDRYVFFAKTFQWKFFVLFLSRSARMC